ncbi:NADH-quinone oxidoreductase subunit C [Aeromicrobium chenweiae]|uniref:NADH-quinone oxidoreductase subunit C n=1 Tax=Aeromicrobium chenweiae TaxID=2079793 RepID=A0A2S0WQJ0_9ACTN|nr:NADH-quinone oxidoreductase subunit C [Aeromicrobium chenweiae]AWB93504.1 NADH-quinone oxidoreductase subunit C [Aeromicrobium chenweiae]TGN34497.1 NADH-quinone oxidoreductase subunit C [Aeromicrobium chenweiae]
MTIELNAFGPPHRVVETGAWHDAVAGLKQDGYTFFDWLSAVDELPDGFRLVVHLARVPTFGEGAHPLDHLLLVTYLDREEPTVASVADVFAGASWHERETHEMFGITFLTADAEPASTAPLLLPDGFEGHPLRKEFVLASRVAKPWPGAKEPGESAADSTRRRSRRRVKPPGVPEPGEWGPRE